MNVAVIPARAGSKRIPGKNSKLFHGKPIVHWPLSVALSSGIFDRVVVSTDCPIVADIARSMGAEVPFTRPEALSGDHVSTVPVIQHAIRYLDLPEHSHVCCIYPTAVFITAQILEQALSKLDTKQADFVMPIVGFNYPVERALTLGTSGQLDMLNPIHINTRTQDCQPLFHDVGQFYFGSRSAWLSERDFYQHRVFGIPVNRSRAIDIDNLDDFVFAELIFSHLDKV